jgi:hypothetical protein
MGREYRIPLRMTCANPKVGLDNTGPAWQSIRFGKPHVFLGPEIA